MSFPVSNQAGISIHAPTRGATDIPCHTSSVGEFQSTLPRGERPGYAALHTVHLTDFNPRSHEGSDGNLYNGVLRIIDFNPRSHEGSDRFLVSSFGTRTQISIHAPTRGAT